MTAKYTESQITELRQYAEFYDLSSINEAINYCTKCHFCGKKCDMSIHTHSHTYCRMHCADMSEDFNYCCFRGESCKICSNYSICKGKLISAGYPINQCDKFLSSQKEFTYKLKSNNSAVTVETKILSKTISTGKAATISHIVKYKSSTFIAQLNDNDKEDIVEDDCINSNVYNISIKDLGEVLMSCIKINNEDLYSKEEIEEIEHSIVETNGWKQELDTYYEIFDGCSLEPTRKYSEVVKSSSH
jgi:hypothetical protein